MKSGLIVASVMALASTASTAQEVGIVVSHDHNGNGGNAAGISLGTKIGDVGVTGLFERAGVIEQDRYTLMVDKVVTKVMSVSVAPRIGVSVTDNRKTEDGASVFAGLGVILPIDQKLSVGAALDRHFGQSRISEFNGNKLSMSVKYSF